MRSLVCLLAAGWLAASTCLPEAEQLAWHDGPQDGQDLAFADILHKTARSF